jgi:hypothetical protein
VKSSPSLFNGFIAPGVGARLREDSAAALDFISPSANPWTRDPRTVGRVEANAISATKNAVKRYVVEQLGLNGWSVPLAGGNGHGLASMRTDAGGMRLRFGISHMAPRAELLIPAGNTGRVAIGVDGRGHMAASFETASWNWRIGGSYDPSSHDLAIGIVSRF